MNIGKAIRFYRIAHDITQKEIAEKAGLSMSYLSLLERELAEEVERDA